MLCEACPECRTNQLCRLGVHEAHLGTFKLILLLLAYSSLVQQALLQLLHLQAQGTCMVGRNSNSSEKSRPMRSTAHTHAIANRNRLKRGAVCHWAYLQHVSLCRPPHLGCHLLQLHMHLCPLSTPVMQLLLNSMHPDLCLAQRLLPVTRISACCSHPLLSSLQTCFTLHDVTSAIWILAVFL